MVWYRGKNERVGVMIDVRRWMFLAKSLHDLENGEEEGLQDKGRRRQ
jgi:hypothetical protein